MTEEDSRSGLPLTVSEAARTVSDIVGSEVAPKVLSDMLYRRELDDRVCPVHAGRRMIPRHYLDVIAQKVRQRRGE
ncbi:hypothetical protein [Humisphaera borealis]|uniref:Uncharacterized protein n=1 Tax=Humisphaera borealis TaxID=2807512 RepID=A0A7M2WW46_9BACT|nr:hypothetical protein [Humisphaera borealis]QOV89758.1 hypothetical protein IPV69_26845 [Humisphaera borealis]